MCCFRTLSAMFPQRGGRGCCFRFASDISTPVYFLAAIVSEAVTVKFVFTTLQVVYGCLAEGLLVYSKCRHTSLYFVQTRAHATALPSYIVEADPISTCKDFLCERCLEPGISIVKPQHLPDGRVAPLQGFWVDVTTPIEISTDLKCA